jgi:hypothetical protein
MSKELGDYVPGCFPATGFPDHVGIYHKSTELPLGRWRAMANGRIYPLVIDSVSASGEIRGTFNTFAIEGEWDGSAIAGRLTFVRDESPVIVQRYTGYLMAFLDEDDQWRMAGVFGKLSVDGSGEEEYEDHAGWYATRLRKE